MQKLTISMATRERSVLQTMRPEAKPDVVLVRVVPGATISERRATPSAHGSAHCGKLAWTTDSRLRIVHTDGVNDLEPGGRTYTVSLGGPDLD